MLLNESGAIALACLEMQMRNTQDFFDSYLPLVLQAAFNCKKKRFGIEDINNSFNATYGNKLPLPVLGTMVGRLVGNSLIVKHKYWGYEIADNAKEPLADEVICESQRHFSELAKGLIDYAESVHSRTIIIEDAKAAILDYIGKYCIECMHISLGNGNKGTDSNGTRLEIEQIVGNFFLNVVKESVHLYTCFEKMVVSQVQACIFLFNRHEDNDDDDFANTMVFLDSPCVLALFHFHSDLRQKVMKDVIGLLKLRHAQLYIFKHTLQEVDAVLNTEIKKFETPADSRHARTWYKERNQNKIDLLEDKDKIVEWLRDYDIQEYDCSIDESIVDVEEIKNAIACVYKSDSQNDETPLFDAFSIAKILTIRAGLDNKKIEDCRAVLMTSNTRLASEARNHQKRRHHTIGLSPVVTHYYISNIAWLLNPQECPQLPIEEFTMYTQALTQIKPENFKALLAIIEQRRIEGKLTTERAAFLRTKSIAYQEVQKESLGKLDALYDLDYNEIAERLEEDANDKNAEERQKLEDTIDELGKKIEELEKMNDEITAENKRIQEEKLINEEQQKRRTARGLAYSVCLILAVPALALYLHEAGTLSQGKPLEELIWRIVKLAATGIGTMGLFSSYHEIITKKIFKLLYGEPKNPFNNPPTVTLGCGV